MRKLLVMLVVLPLAALAQAPNGPGPNAGKGPGPGFGPNGGPSPERVERMERRMRLARTLGLAEALDLDAPQALKLGETVARFDERRLAAHKQLRDAHEALRRAARAEKGAPAVNVDETIQRALDARTQLAAIDREVLAAVTKDLSPERKARAVLFLEKFSRRMGPGPGPGFGPGGGPGGRGFERGFGRGMGMGRGAMNAGPGAGGPGPMVLGPMGFDEDDEEP